MPKPTNKIKLCVNGILDLGGSESATDYTADWSAHGSLAIGRAWDGDSAQRWVGDLDDVYAVQRVWEETEILQYAIQ